MNLLFVTVNFVVNRLRSCQREHTRINNPVGNDTFQSINNLKISLFFFKQKNKQEMLNVTVADVSFTLGCLQKKNILKITGKKGLDNTPKNVVFIS